MPAAAAAQDVASVRVIVALEERRDVPATVPNAFRTITARHAQLSELSCGRIHALDVSIVNADIFECIKLGVLAVVAH